MAVILLPGSENFLCGKGYAKILYYNIFRTLPLVEPYIKFIEPRLNYMTEWLDQFYEMLITELNRIPKRPIHEKPERFDNVFSACPYLNARANFAAIEADEGSR